MRNVVQNFNISNNFWEYNPQLKIVFRDFYRKDKSRGKKKSSDIMWGMFLCLHPKSDMYNIPEKEEIIAKDVIGDKDFKWEDYSGIMDTVESTCLSQAEKSLIKWDKTLRKRDAFIHEQDFTLDEYDDLGKTVKGTADQLDKMLANSGKLFQEYFKIREMMYEEEKIDQKGSKIVSESEKDHI